LKTLILVPVLLVLIYILGSFKKEPTIGELLAKNFENEIYNDFDTTAFESVFIKTIDSLSSKITNAKSIKTYYASNGYAPKLIVEFYGNKNLDSLENYLQNSTAHGFNSKIFSTEEIRNLLDKLKANAFNKVEESYPVIAKLELLSANAYTNYASYLKFGAVNPRKIFLQYYIDVKQPDSLFIPRLLNSASMLDTLRNLQDKSEQYKALQFAYLHAKNDSIRRVLSVNMERLRWVLPEMGKQYVQVNIPDFSLVYFNHQDTLTQMKVCVGGKREKDYEEKLKIFEKTRDLDDRPKNHETPMLFSTISTLYANPVWNIPESIAQTEIYSMARKNRNYLSKNNIKVYYKNKLIRNPSSIRWYKYSREKLPFRFVQGPGTENSLGKFKFFFPNNSSIYLHDTDYKKAFKFSNRAISHGCIRLEKPLKLAELLVSDKNNYDKLRMEVGLNPLDSARLVLYKKKQAEKVKTESPELKPSVFAPKKPVPLLITYHTAWAQNDKIEYRPDVYGMDEKLWAAMKKFR